MFGQPDIDECVTMAQFNELRQSMEERQDRLTQDFQALMAKIRRHRQPHDGASNHGDHEESAGAAARGRREQGRRNRGATHDRRKGRGRRHNDSDESENVDDDGNFQNPFGRQPHRRGNQEERFGKLKFTNQNLKEGLILKLISLGS